MEASGSWLVSGGVDERLVLSNVGILGLGGRWFVPDRGISTFICKVGGGISEAFGGGGGGGGASDDWLASLIKGGFKRMALSRLGGRRSTSDGGTSDIGVGMGGCWSMDNSALRFGRGGASGGWP